MLVQDIQQQLEELQQSVEESSELAAQVQQLRQQNLQLNRCCVCDLLLRSNRYVFLRCIAVCVPLGRDSTGVQHGRCALFVDSMSQKGLLAMAAHCKPYLHFSVNTTTTIHHTVVKV